MPGVYAFIDSQNLNLSIKACGWDLNFHRFLVYLKDKYKVEKAYLFIGYVAGNESLYAYLQKAGYILIFKPTLKYNKDSACCTKGNVDAELVMHVMLEFLNYNKAIIVSGDGDFHCLLEHLDKQGKLDHLIIPNPNKYSALLRKFRKYMVFISHLKNKLGKKNERE